MSDETIERRLAAVERAVSTCPEDSPGDDNRSRDRDLADRLDDVETDVAELEAAVQAVRGYVGSVKHVNDEVERRADAALAKADRVERALAHPPRRTSPRSAEQQDAPSTGDESEGRLTAGDGSEHRVAAGDESEDQRTASPDSEDRRTAGTDSEEHRTDGEGYERRRTAGEGSSDGEIAGAMRPGPGSGGEHLADRPPAADGGPAGAASSVTPVGTTSVGAHEDEDDGRGPLAQSGRSDDATGLLARLLEAL